MSVIPTGPQVMREAVLVIAGATLAALIMANIPELRDWIRAQWRAGGSGCNCNH